MTSVNGTQHYYEYDGLGRQTQDCVILTVGSIVDDTVLRIETTSVAVDDVDYSRLWR